MWDSIHLLTIFPICDLTILLFLFLPCYSAYCWHIYSSLAVSVWIFDFISTGMWDLKSSLPLELCSIASLAFAIMLLTTSHQLYIALIEIRKFYTYLPRKN